MTASDSPLLNAAGNVGEFSVSEISQAVKRTLEGAFDHVRIRGEVGRPNYHGSGHLYFNLKDENATIDAVCWRGTVNRLSLRLEEGMEVICTGRISSYPKSSRYQVVVEAVELAGEGALLKLLEDRRKKLAAEGLFAEEHKRPLPFLPEVIGVVTSPTGAVIRDILHRLNDRFPRHVLVWPVKVQGDGAAEEIAAAVRGFNNLQPDGAVPRPDLLIVARGGGSLEDLWCFNEEAVVRAAADSDIPLISAVGHETDTTLIDYASDRRAPTPTAAAEMAVPVRIELLAQVQDDGQRMTAAMARRLEQVETRLEGLARGLPEPARLLEVAWQRLDDETDRLRNAWRNLDGRQAQRVTALGGRLRSPDQLIVFKSEQLRQASERMATAGTAGMRTSHSRLDGLDAGRRMAGGMARFLDRAENKLENLHQRLENLSHKNVLKRGFALVRDSYGDLVQQTDQVAAGDALSVEVSDGAIGVTVSGDAPPDKNPARKRSPAQKANKTESKAGKKPDERQGKLL